MINERLRLLRHEMAAEGIDAIIFPTNDPHGSEYVAPHWQARQYVSGFTGSAGTAVVTATEAALWTDSRYFLQAAEQLSGTEYQLMKDGMADTPTVTEWLLRKMSANGGTCIAVDGMVASYSVVKQLQLDMQRIGVSVRTNYDAMRMIWHERPAIPASEIYAIEQEYTGETATERLRRIREKMTQCHADAFLTTDLMEVAWTLNLRGSDLPMTPVFVSFLLVEHDNATLYCNGKLSDSAQKVLSEARVAVKPYTKLQEELQTIDSRILCDSTVTCHTLYKNIKHVIDQPSPVQTFKAVKNTVEIGGFRQSMLLDGIALVKWLRWLKPAVAAGGQTEISVSDKLEQLRKEAKEFRSLSFDTISGYNAHGAIVHYSATPQSNAALKPEGLLLVDSGAQYTCGTTDITRTIALGPVSKEMRHAYTHVLKANIALATTPFPENTNGTQLDSVARSVLWRGGLHYMHGTGHGVGWRLCVHEGPQGIRQPWTPAPLCPGMVVTDEPGVYIEGCFGVRIENMMLVEQAENPTGLYSMNRLTPLTLCPIDTAPIDVSLMTTDEIHWLNRYHSHVREALLPLLSDEADRQWLVEATQEI